MPAMTEIKVTANAMFFVLTAILAYPPFSDLLTNSFNIINPSSM